SAELDAVSGELADHEEHLAQVVPAAEAAGQAWFTLSALAERVDATARVATERSRYLDEPVTASSGPDPEDLERQADEAAETEAEMTAAVESAAEFLEGAKDELAQRERAAAAAEQAHLAAVRAIADRREGLARLEGQVDNLRTKADSVDAETTRLTEAIAAAVERSQIAQTQQDEVAESLGELEASEKGLDEHHERCVSALNLSNERVATLQAEEREAEQRIASLTARIEALSVGLERGDGGAWLMENVADGLLGPMSELLTVDAGYETAIAGALGGAVDAIAAADPSSALRALELLKAGDGGRASMIVGGLTHTPSPRTDPLPDGAVWASSVVTCAPSVRAAIELILADTVLVDSTEAAVEVAGALGVRAVTGDGDRVSRATIEGGSSHRPSTLEVQSAIDTATTDLAATRRRVEELAAALQGALAEQQQRREAAEQALAALHESDSAVGGAYEHLARLGQEIRAAQAEADRLTRQRNFVETGRAETVAKLDELEQRLALAQGEGTEEPTGEVDSGERTLAAEAVAAARSAEMEARL
ncbi:chromosome segregation protein SMC, partial [Gordonia sp. i37]